MRRSILKNGKVSIADILKKKGSAVCRKPGPKNKWLLFQSPLEIIETHDLDDVRTAINRIEEFLKDGCHAAGFISYEAGPSFDNAVSAKTLKDFPLLWCAIYDIPPLPLPSFQVSSSYDKVRLKPEIARDAYLEKIDRIREYIYEGDIYQANYTFRAKGKGPQSPGETFLFLMSLHPVPYAGYINTGDFQIISMSPELFLEKRDNIIISMPMKGTAPRKPGAEEDAEQKRWLRNDPKNRAENLMITDMVRNDLGKICRTGTISAKPLFKVNTYRTLHQMISVVSGELKSKSSIWDVLKAAFPAASITGAPKIRASQIINEQETSPRKLYTGSLGCFTPEMDFCLNVAIRTLICRDGEAELGTGSGIVADSDAADEWDESITKTSFLSGCAADFKVLETLLWTRKNGFVYLKEHLDRAKSAQRYFSFPWRQKKLDECLMELSEKLTGIKYARIRLLIDNNGMPHCEYAALEKTGWSEEKIRVLFSNEKTLSPDIFLQHKTTKREFYDNAYRKALAEGFDEVLFCNEKGELTEGSISSLFILKDGIWQTPPQSCGLLPGIWRAKMIDELHAVEKILYPEDLFSAEKIIMGNSVRGGADVKTIHAEDETKGRKSARIWNSRN